MTAVSTFLGNGVLDALRGVSLNVAGLYVGLHSAAPGVNGANEAAGGSYVRQAVTLDAASGKRAANSAGLVFSGLPATVVSHVGFWDAQSGGNFLFGGELVDDPEAAVPAAAPRTIEAGGSLEILTGDLVIQVE